MATAKTVPGAGPRRPAAILGVLLFIEFVSGMIQTYLIPYYSSIAEEYHLDATALSWVLISLVLAAAVCTPTLTKLGDLLGHRRVLRAVVGVVALGTVLVAIAPNTAVLLLGRVFQGALAGLLPTMIGYVRERTEPARAQRAVAYLFSFSLFGACCGLMVSALTARFTDTSQWAEWIPAVLAVLGFGLSFTVPPGSPRKGSLREMDWLGAALLGFGLTGVLVAVSLAPDWGWASADTLACLVGGLALLVAWVAVEARLRLPLVDVRHLFRPKMLATFLTGVGIYIGSDGAQVAVSTFMALPAAQLGYGLGLSTFSIGLVIAAGYFVGSLSAAASNRIAGVIGYPAATALGCAAAGGGFLGMLAVGTSAAAFFACYASVLFGAGLVSACIRVVFVSQLRPGEVSAGTGVLELSAVTGAAVGAAITGTLMGAHVRPSSTVTTGTGYDLVWITSAGLTLAAMLIPLATLAAARRRRGGAAGGEPSAVGAVGTGPS